MAFTPFPKPDSAFYDKYIFDNHMRTVMGKVTLEVTGSEEPGNLIEQELLDKNRNKYIEMVMGHFRRHLSSAEYSRIVSGDDFEVGAFLECLWKHRDKVDEVYRLANQDFYLEFKEFFLDILKLMAIVKQAESTMDEL